MTATEHDEQAALVERCAWLSTQHPDLRLLFAIPNGGMRSKATAGKLKAEGVKSGVPDLCLPIARQGYHGLFIELKTLHGQPSTDQQWWIVELTRQGYLALVCYGQDEAWRVITRYLGIEASASARLTRIETAARAHVAEWDSGDTMAHGSRDTLRKALEER
jgi:hypothetical protein